MSTDINRLIGATIEQVIFYYEEHGDTSALWRVLEMLLASNPDAYKDIVSIMDLEQDNIDRYAIWNEFDWSK